MGSDNMAELISFPLRYYMWGFANYWRFNSHSCVVSPQTKKMLPYHLVLHCETDQLYSRADCEKSNNQIFSSLVSNKSSWISASLKLWYMIVSLLVMELFKKKDRPVSNNHPVYGECMNINEIYIEIEASSFQYEVQICGILLHFK